MFVCTFNHFLNSSPMLRLRLLLLLLSDVLRQSAVLLLVTVRLVEDEDDEEKDENAQGDGDAVANDRVVVGVVGQLGGRGRPVVLVGAVDGHVAVAIVGRVEVARPLEFILEEALLLRLEGVVTRRRVGAFRWALLKEGANQAQHDARLLLMMLLLKKDKSSELKELMLLVSGH